MATPRIDDPPEWLADEFEEPEQVIAVRQNPWKEAARELYASKAALASAGFILFVIFLAIFAPWIAPYDPQAMSLPNRMLPAAWDAGGDWRFVLGTDGQGRDILSRIMYGSQMTLIVGLAAVILGGIVGVTLGLIAGYFGGWLDALLMRFTDLQLAFPSLLLGLLVMAIIGTGVIELICVIALAQWAYYARVIRAEAIRTRELEFVQGATALGASHRRILLQHILPNCVASMVIIATFSLSYAIYYEAALSFFGLGIPPAIPTWGNMLAVARDIMLRNFWAPVFPGLAITLTVLAFNLLGDWLRDYFDVRV
ncbi:MAG: ABC transporter permease [Halofilum sp. (in: g-proteobacteria)]